MTPDKKARAKAISTLIRLGWSPPAPSSAIAERILDDMRKRTDHGGTVQLTERETQILELFAAGHTRQEIADTLGIGMENVKTRLDLIRDKLGARNTTHAVHLADQQGLLEAA